jgi:hypothetical protein
MSWGRNVVMLRMARAAFIVRWVLFLCLRGSITEVTSIVEDCAGSKS